MYIGSFYPDSVQQDIDNYVKSFGSAFVYCLKRVKDNPDKQAYHFLVNEISLDYDDIFDDDFKSKYYLVETFYKNQLCL